MGTVKNKKPLRKVLISGKYPSETFTYLAYLFPGAKFSGTLLPFEDAFAMNCESEVSGKAAVDKHIGTMCAIHPRKPLSFTATLGETDIYEYTFKKGILTCKKKIGDAKYKEVSVSPISETRKKEIEEWKKDNKERDKRATALAEEIIQKNKAKKLF